jgi:hypothetical protein
MGGCHANWISSQSGTGTLLGWDSMGVRFGLSFRIDHLSAPEADGAETTPADLNSGMPTLTHGAA